MFLDTPPVQLTRLMVKLWWRCLKTNVRVIFYLLPNPTNSAQEKMLFLEHKGWKEKAVNPNKIG